MTEGAVPPLVELCSSSTDNRVLGYAAETLLNLALHEGSGPQIVQEGAVRPLVQLCKTSDDNTMLQYAALALANLALHESSRVRIVEDGAVQPLVQLCSTSEDNTALGYSALALTRLAVPEGTNMTAEVGASALYGLVKAQQTLGRNLPVFLIQPLADAIAALTPKPPPQLS